MNIKQKHPRSRKHIAIVTMGVKLGDEARGYTRFRFLSELLVRSGFDVDLITSSFQHWEKAQRDCLKPCYQNLPYRIIFIEEPGYAKNLDPARIYSHHIAAKNLRTHFANTTEHYDLIYAEIPPNDVARVCAEYAERTSVPFVADINDLWPEAMRMVVNIPLLSSIVFYPFARDAKIVYRLLSGAVGTSDEYTARPQADRSAPYPHKTVYVGNDIAAFDAGAAQHKSEINKPDNEIWVSYAGTLGASYDLCTLIEAAAILKNKRTEDTPQDHTGHAPQEQKLKRSAAAIRIKILGDGPDRTKLETYAASLHAPVDFLGYQDYAFMAAYLCASDILVNSLVKSAAQSIVTKIGDYLASGKPLINTGSSPEFRTKVTTDGFGLNVEAENACALALAIQKLACNASLRKIMGAKGRAIAEREFDQQKSYQEIVNLIRNLL